MRVEPTEAGTAAGPPRYLAIGMPDLPDHDDWLTPPEAERLQRFAYTKRREEARLGRWTAKHTLAAALGLAPEMSTLRELVIRNASDGAPEVFIDDEIAPLHISMTDRADWAVCAVIAADRSGGAIGCDLELVEPRSPVFVSDWFTEPERESIALEPDRHDLLANLIWSAKESALKVLRTGLRRDTRSVEVTISNGDVHRGDDLSGEWLPLRVVAAEGDSFPGWWLRAGDFVLTYVSVADTGPPRSLADPPPLQHAVPAHSWLANPRRMAGETS